jgi:hypothetical protein
LLQTHQTPSKIYEKPKTAFGDDNDDAGKTQSSDCFLYSNMWRIRCTSVSVQVVPPDKRMEKVYKTDNEDELSAILEI